MLYAKNYIFCFFIFSLTINYLLYFSVHKFFIYPRNILEHVFEALSILSYSRTILHMYASTEIKKRRTLYSVLCTWNEYGGRKLKLFPLKTAISSLENL